jgi:hypothetical protein
MHAQSTINLTLPPQSRLGHHKNVADETQRRYAENG